MIQNIVLFINIAMLSIQEVDEKRNHNTRKPEEEIIRLENIILYATNKLSYLLKTKLSWQINQYENTHKKKSFYTI